MRLIDADELKEIRHKYIQGQIKFDGNEYDLIDKCPTVDAVPVVRGKWDNIPNTYMSVASKDGSYSGNATTCSVCHEVNPNAYKTNYCPNCGAKMDLEE